MSDFSLPLNLDTERSFETFLTGIEDERVRKGLLQQTELPEGVRQVVELVQDEEFLQRAQDLVHKLNRFQEVSQIRLNELRLAPPQVSTNAASDPSAQIAQLNDDMKTGGHQLHDYLKTKYPVGMELLTRYGEVATPRAVPMAATATPWVAANAGAVVNAAVWANVAVATQAVVAAAAVAVAAVWVTSSAKPVPGITQV